MALDGFIKQLRQKSLICIVIVFALTLQGCLWKNLGASASYQLPQTPILQSSISLILDGERGIWIDERDTANLLLWIQEIEEFKKNN